MILTIFLGVFALMAAVIAWNVSHENDKLRRENGTYFRRLINRPDPIPEIERTPAIGRRYAAVPRDNRIDVMMRVPYTDGDCAGIEDAIHTCCWVPVKTFFPADDPEFARLQAAELIEKLEE